MMIKVCRCGMDMNYPQNWSWLLMIAAIVWWFHIPDGVTLEVEFASAASRPPGVLTSFILVLLALAGPHGLLPSWRLLRVIEFLKQFVLKAKATQLWLPLARSQSLSHSLSLPVLCSQGLVLVLIKAVSFCVLPAFFHSLLWAERKQPHRGKRNEEVTKSRVWREQILCYSAIQPVGGNMQLASKGQMPGIGSLYGAVWCLLPLQSFHPPTPSLLLLLLLPPCWGVWFEGVLGGKPVCSLPGCKSRAQPVEAHL